ncbi:hypothetical protein BABINDRAFT_139269 [Babjeviella inositovora NRRL Y-12698]|uniref:Uncharacterized protein n=1 Tax=Babjeviella inositovora NRRL Y-12698 TaxID=984486 RepID=A0A1E3QRD8_9ASCO|nr:uncharacterized protein BABINDRAFT_139269 [Babjeviella inositovora NRRL Y-12698]ODQ80054.1 hypothetical protein BABINDRAFT_139269 [Babjeviella inositovora NRRL Y-12698]
MECQSMNHRLRLLTDRVYAERVCKGQRYSPSPPRHKETRGTVKSQCHTIEVDMTLRPRQPLHIFTRILILYLVTNRARRENEMR